MMKTVQQRIEDYLDAVEAAKGKRERDRLHVEWTGGAHVVIHDRESDERKMVDIGTLVSMTEVLRAKERPLAA
ncbi:MAG: hypothetical protein R8K47_09005 [Mariprofundaceae bacterium]